MKNKFKKFRKFEGRPLQQILHKIPLLFIMMAIGLFTVFAASNTYEVIARQDVAYSNVIKDVRLTADATTDQRLSVALSQPYDQGSFGVPKKIKLPETNKHIDVVDAEYDNGVWKASRGIGHTFVSASPRQKVFGEAVIYMRINTLTTRGLGEVYNGDIVNVVTTEGWQLGYRVVEKSDDPSGLQVATQTTDSEIRVILIDDQNNSIRSFRAVLAKVGERV